MAKWASESIKIPFQNPLTGRHTVYVPDFFIQYNNKNGKAVYHHNDSFESSGSSLSTIIKDDSFWILSRKIILKIFCQFNRLLFI